jgi:hypothetical protein
MEESESSSRKRARRQYSLEPDLEVIIDGEAFPVQSVILMSASPVFRRMLESGMAESLEGKIHLQGKDKAWGPKLDPKNRTTKLELVAI